MYMTFPDPVKHIPAVDLFQPLDCATTSTAKRKRSDDIESCSMEQSKRTPEKESSTDSDYKIRRKVARRKK